MSLLWQRVGSLKETLAREVAAVGEHLQDRIEDANRPGASGLTGALVSSVLRRSSLALDFPRPGTWCIERRGTCSGLPKPSPDRSVVCSVRCRQGKGVDDPRRLEKALAGPGQASCGWVLPCLAALTRPSQLTPAAVHEAGHAAVVHALGSVRAVYPTR